jgi:GDP-L-fucose synthase
MVVDNMLNTILITGGTGMVGKNLINHSQAENCSNLIAPTRNQVNLLDYNSIKEFMQSTKPDLVIHAAGKVGGISANMADPYGFLYENLTMGMNVVHAAKQVGVKNLINLGSSCMYPRNALNPLREQDLLTGELEPTNEGYAIAKNAVAKLCLAACNTGFKYKTFIPCNLYGYWDNFHPVNSHMIPAIVRKVYESKKNNDAPIEIWGSGTVKRESLFAEDLADFIYFAADNFDRVPSIMNVGSGVQYSILEYYETAKKALDAKGEFIFDLSKPEGMKQKVVDVTEQNKLGWHPKTDLYTGFEKTYNYYREFIK